jgi:hypothetical protein
LRRWHVASGWDGRIRSFVAVYLHAAQTWLPGSSDVKAIKPPGTTGSIEMSLGLFS